MIITLNKSILQIGVGKYYLSKFTARSHQIEILKKYIDKWNSLNYCNYSIMWLYLKVWRHHNSGIIKLCGTDSEGCAVARQGNNNPGNPIKIDTYLKGGNSLLLNYHPRVASSHSILCILITAESTASCLFIPSQMLLRS